ncbi:Frataxin-like protein [Yarrowia sp. B02]|nr:Frataxin-like protein [Yarrowia sp. B02]
MLRSLRAVPRIALAARLLTPRAAQPITRSLTTTVRRATIISPRITQYGTLRQYSPEATDIDIEEYHLQADEFLESILIAYENYAEEVDSNELDVDLAQGVMSLEIPGAGSYVINKQPPNKQIWLSSPISGPKRYDYVDGEWVYLRDGTTLTELLETETSEAFASTGKKFSL